MEIAIVKTGQPIKLIDGFFLKPKFDTQGFLISFSYFNGEKSFDYKYFKPNDFRKIHQFNTNLTGYFREDLYLQYIVFKDDSLITDGTTVPRPVDIIDTRFNFTEFLATPRIGQTPGDIASVRVLEFNAPYTIYYEMIEYVFEIESIANSVKPKSYLQYQDGKISMAIPFTATKNPLSIDKSLSATGRFYEKNFVNVIDIVDDKEKFARLCTFICFKISQISKNIFDNMISQSKMANLDFIANATPSNELDLELEALPIIEQAIFHIKREWGFYGLSTNNPEFDSIFSEPNYDLYKDYYRILRSFYSNTYRSLKYLETLSDDQKIFFLIEMLPHQALQLVPYDLRIKYLEKFIIFESIYDAVVIFGQTHRSEVIPLKIVHSISEVDANRFLDYILEKKDGITTNFERLYELIDDSRAYRYPFVSFFASPQTNRKYFIHLLHQLWRKSKYPMYNIQEGANGENEIILNEDSYFLNDPDGKIYSIDKPDILDFQYSEEGEFFKFTEKSSKFIPNKEIKGNDIKIDRVDKKVEAFVSLIGGGSGQVSENETTVFLGTFHLYQPIVIVGYKVDYDLVDVGIEAPSFIEDNKSIMVPQNTFIPAFLFYYAHDYNEIKEFDAAVSLVIEIVLEIGIFYFFVALGPLKVLSHLKKTTQIGRAMSGTLDTTISEVVVFTSREIGYETFSASASVLGSTSLYLASLYDNVGDEQVYKLYQTVGYVLLGLTLYSAGKSIQYRDLATQKATVAIQQIDELSNLGKSHNLDDEIVEMLTFLRNHRLVAQVNFRNFISTVFDNVDGVTTNHLIDKFDNVFTANARLQFQQEFGNVNVKQNIDFWKILNNDSGDLMLKWQSMYLIKIGDRSIVEFVSNKKLVNAILRYYELPDPDFRNVLEGMDYTDRSRFLDKFGDIPSDFFDTLKTKLVKIEQWSDTSSVEKTFCEEYKRLFIETDLDPRQIADLNNEHVLKIREKINVDHNYIYPVIKSDDPINKTKSLEYLANGGRVTAGNYIEAPAIEFIRRNLTSNQEGYVSVDIVFLDATGESLHKGVIRDIDGLILNKSSNKFEEIKSCKLPIGRTSKKQEIDILKAYGNMPISGQQNILDYMNNNDLLRKKFFKGKENIESFEFKMVNVRTKEKVVMDAQEFQIKVKGDYNFNDVIEINPASFDTTKDELILGVYEHLNLKFNQ